MSAGTNGTITGTIRGQHLTLIEPYIVSDSVNYIRCAFSFSPDWTPDLNLYAHFEKLSGGTPRIVPIAEDGTVSEDYHIDLSDGIWEIYVVGEKIDVTNTIILKRITTNRVRIRVIRSGVQGGEPFDDETPSIGETIVAEAEAYADAAAASATEAEGYAERAEAAAESVHDVEEQVARAETAATTATEKASAASLSASSAESSATSAAVYASDASSAATAAQEATVHAPRIGTSGTWEVWNQQSGAYEDTGVEATGEDGEDGHSPYIGVNGHWFVWVATDYVDSGVNATGPAGETGDPGVYVGDTEPADPDIMVWVKETGDEVTIPTPVAKTAAMTQAVGMDAETGQLYTTPGGGGGGGAVSSVNGQTGDVVLDAEDVGALPDDTVIPDALSDLSDDATHRLVTDVEKSTWNAKGTYSKPSGGIPASDLASGAATTLVLRALTIDTVEWTAEQQEAAQERMGILSVEEVLF
mgnify:CR=1 FL=1